MCIRDRCDQPLVGNLGGQSFFNALFSHVQIDFPRPAAHVTEIRVRHFAGPVDDATHNGNLNVDEVAGSFLDAIGGALQVE